jgi:hypothetical protein
MDWLKGRLNDDVIIKRESDWQLDLKADRNKLPGFKEKAQTLQSFTLFLLMRLQSGYLTCVHSAHVYHSSAAVLSENDGEFIGFIGNI